MYLILLARLPKCWDYRCIQCLACFSCSALILVPSTSFSPILSGKKCTSPILSGSNHFPGAASWAAGATNVLCWVYRCMVLLMSKYYIIYTQVCLLESPLKQFEWSIEILPVFRTQPSSIYRIIMLKISSAYKNYRSQCCNYCFSCQTWFRKAKKKTVYCIYPPFYSVIFPSW